MLLQIKQNSRFWKMNQTNYQKSLSNINKRTNQRFDKWI